MRENICRIYFCDKCPHRHKLHLYLSHPIKIRKMVREFELFIEKKYDIELLNPFYDADREEILAMDRGEDIHKIYEELNPDNIVRDDLYYMDCCNGILSILGDGDSGSFGTPCEVWDTCIKNKPIYIITHFLENHPWVRYVTKKTGGKVFTGWIDFLEFMESELLVKKIKEII